jgi:ethanolamine ammonia-lyase small subunit
MADSTLVRTPAQLLTPARLSLGSDAPAASTADHLRFQLDHALARDAVHAPLDVALIVGGLKERGLHTLLLRSNAADRASYLRRPDLGRSLNPDSIESLNALPSAAEPRGIAIILADGLSALALERHALPLIDALRPLITDPYPYIPLAQDARVAIGDEIGHLLRAEITILLIGERPGLSSPDSLGAYITWQPRRGRSDAERNCISNIRTEGLSYQEAAHRIAHYLREAQRLHTTGIALKDPELNLLP